MAKLEIYTHCFCIYKPHRLEEERLAQKRIETLIQRVHWQELRE